MKRWIGRIATVLLLLALAGVALSRYSRSSNGQVSAFQTVQVTRGGLLVSIDATGTLEPEEVVDIGAQVGGRIISLGQDASGKVVDYGSNVEENAVLATIDDTLYQADVSEAQSKVKSAKASVQRTEADVKQLQAKLLQAERDWARAQKLGPSEALAQATYDSYESAYETAKANVDVGKAAVVESEASLAQAESNLWRAQRNLGYCTILSPVKGVIIDRRVNIGQTVNASMSAPSLFLIAKDLKRMKVWVAVNEADIAKVHSGQPVTFTVDALPDEIFEGVVDKIRPNASMTQNVVTYTVEISTDNTGGRLLPYLSANVKFEVSRRENVLLVPNAALRWTPSVEQVAPEFRNESSQAQGTPDSTPADLPDETAPTTDHGPAQKGILYVVQGQYVRPLPVRIGISNGVYTEVEGQGLTEGIELVTGMQTAAAAAAASAETSNPFTPKMPKPPKGAGPPPR